MDDEPVNPETENLDAALCWWAKHLFFAGLIIALAYRVGLLPLP